MLSKVYPTFKDNSRRYWIREVYTKRIRFCFRARGGFSSKNSFIPLYSSLCGVLLAMGGTAEGNVKDRENAYPRYAKFIYRGGGGNRSDLG